MHLVPITCRLCMVIPTCIWCLGRYHRRDKQHAAKTMRPGLLLGLYLILLLTACVGNGVVGAITVSLVSQSLDTLGHHLLGILGKPLTWYPW